MNKSRESACICVVTLYCDQCLNLMQPFHRTAESTRMSTPHEPIRRSRVSRGCGAKQAGEGGTRLIRQCWAVEGNTDRPVSWRRTESYRQVETFSWGYVCLPVIDDLCFNAELVWPV